MSLRKRGRSVQELQGGSESPDRHPVLEAIQPAFDHFSETVPLSHEQRREIISSYSILLERCKAPIAKESDLPWPKDLIEKAICEEIIENPDETVCSQLRTAYVLLESFLSAEDWDAIEYFKLANTLAQEMAESGRPEDIVASARILKTVRGEKAVGIQERIWESKDHRLSRIKRIERNAPVSCS